MAARCWSVNASRPESRAAPVTPHRSGGDGGQAERLNMLLNGAVNDAEFLAFRATTAASPRTSTATQAGALPAI